MIKSCKEAGFWLKSSSFNNGCNLRTLSRLGADKLTEWTGAPFGTMGRPARAAGSKGQQDCDFSISKLLDSWGVSWDSWLLAVVYSGRGQAWRIAYHSSYTFWWPCFLTGRMELCTISSPLVVIYSFVEQIFLKSLMCSKYVCLAPWKAWIRLLLLKGWSWGQSDISDWCIVRNLVVRWWHSLLLCFIHLLPQCIPTRQWVLLRLAVLWMFYCSGNTIWDILKKSLLCMWYVTYWGRRTFLLCRAGVSCSGGLSLWSLSHKTSGAWLDSAGQLVVWTLWGWKSRSACCRVWHDHKWFLPHQVPQGEACPQPRPCTRNLVASPPTVRS